MASPVPNALEQLLTQTIMEPASLPALFRELMAATLQTLVYPHQAPLVQHQKVKAGALDWLLSPAGEAVWFTSAARLADAPGELTPDGEHLPFPLSGTGYELLSQLYRVPEMRLPIVLNYGSPLTLRLLPAQIHGLMQGYLQLRGLAQFAQAGTPHTLRPPPNPSLPLVAALSTHCAKRPDLRALYLAEWEWPNYPKPRLLLAYDAPGPRPARARPAPGGGRGPGGAGAQALRTAYSG